MSRPNAIKQIAFPETPEAGFEVVLGSRIEDYLTAHPQATEEEAYAAGVASLLSAAVPLRIDAVVAGIERRLNVIATLPTNEQMDQGNHALELSFVETGDDEPIGFGDPAISAWVESCSEELFEAVYAYFQNQL